MKYAFFPGCSLSATGRPYGMALHQVARILDLDLPELEDWNCCGTSVLQTVDEQSFLAFGGRNLALAEKAGSEDIVTPCSGCFYTLSKANHALATVPESKRDVDETLSEAGLRYDGGVRVRHLLDVVVDDVGLDDVRARVTRSLSGLKAVCYYGCLLTRPPAISGATDAEYPMAMDRLIRALGAEALDWSYKTECCGAFFTLPNRDLGVSLTGKILRDARAVGADLVVAACALCQGNLDMYQGDADQPMPIVYFAQLMGLALGLEPDSLGLNRHFRDPLPALRRLSLAT